MASVFDSLITYVKVDSEWGPTVVIDKPLAPLPPGTKGPLATLKPRIEIGLSTGSPVVIQKWGKPGPTKWPTLVAGAGIGGGILLALAGYGLFALLRKKKKG